MNLTPLQKQRLVQIYPELGDWFDLQEIKNRKPEDRALSESILVTLINKIESLRGEDGYTPVKGKDYFTDAELNQIISYLRKEVTPIKGKDYFDGEKGDKGDSYVLTPKDRREIAKSITVPVVEKIIERTEIVKEIPAEIDVDEIMKPIEKKLTDGMARVDGRIKAIDQRWHGGGLSKVSHDSTLSGSGTPSDPLTVISSGNSLNVLAFTGSVNGSNQTFVASRTVTLAIADQGRIMQKTSSDGTSNWTGTSTITLSIAPTSDIILLG